MFQRRDTHDVASDATRSTTPMQPAARAAAASALATGNLRAAPGAAALVGDPEATSSGGGGGGPSVLGAAVRLEAERRAGGLARDAERRALGSAALGHMRQDTGAAEAVAKRREEDRNRAERAVALDNAAGAAAVAARKRALEAARLMQQGQLAAQAVTADERTRREQALRAEQDAFLLNAGAPEVAVAAESGGAVAAADAVVSKAWNTLTGPSAPLYWVVFLLLALAWFQASFDDNIAAELDAAERRSLARAAAEEAAFEAAVGLNDTSDAVSLSD